MKKNRVGKINEYNILGLNIQIVLTITLCVFAILGFVLNSKFFDYMKIFIGLDLLIMAYNNERVYHNKKVTIIYIIFGIIVLVFGILNLFGVI